jgi:hypothetical protein
MIKSRKISSDEIKNEQEIKQSIETLIQCEKVTLRECNFSYINPDEYKDEPKIKFAVQPLVFNNQKMISELKVCILNIQTTKRLGQLLKFTMVAFFKGDENTTTAMLGEFGQLYSLSILWPYAREFAQDTFSRSGLSSSPLPVINPTATTQDMMRQGLIEVLFQDDLKE